MKPVVQGVCLVVGCLLLARPTLAADPEFVGKMAYLVDEGVARKLGLSDTEREKLIDWVDQREADAAEIVLSLRDMPEEQAAKLKEFVAESERLGMAMLSEAQREQLNQIEVARQGLASLGESEVQEKVGLDAEQREEVAKLLAQREEAFGKATASQMASTTAYFERKLAAVLSPQQRLEWEKLAGRADADAQLADAGDTQPGDNDPEENTTDTDEPDDGDDENPAVGREEEPRPSVDVGPRPIVDSRDEQPSPPRPQGDVKLKFKFRYAPWETVLEWFADQAGLSLELTNTPPGTFNYTDPHEYTPAEAIDLLNSVLLTKGYTLVRHRQMLMVLNLEDGIPANLIEIVPPEELDDRGRYELLSTLIKLEDFTAEDAENEIRKLLGPQGSIVVLPQTGALLVTETGGRLKMMRDLLQSASKPPEVEETPQLTEMVLEHALAEEVLGVIRQLMGLPEDRNASADGTLRIATDTLGTRLFVTGTEENIEKIQEILKLVDVPNGLDGTPGVIETPQLEVYTITAADPESVLKVMQTLMAGETGVRLDIDPKTGSLVALARPSQHATIKATIDQMQRDGRMIEVIQLNVVDPQLAVLSINKLFGAGEEGGNARAPMVDADPISAQLLVRGTETQIEQIRSLLEKMGETGDVDSAYAQAERGNVRMIPLTGGSARSALDQLEMIWPSMRQNRIRVVTPSAAVREMYNGSGRESIAPSGGSPLNCSPLNDPLGLPPDLQQLNDLFQRFEIRPRERAPQQDPSPDQLQPPKVDGPPANPTNDTSRPAPPTPKSPPPPQVDEDDQQAAIPSSPFRFVAQTNSLVQTEGANDVADDNTELSDAEGEQDDTPVSKPGADIIVAPGPNGILIASEDLDALDEFEELLQMLASRGTTGREYTVFYLKYARAEVAAELLNEILGGGASSGGGEGGGLFGDLASAALGDTGGGLVGSLLGLGGGGGSISTSGTVTMVADRRLNALVVEANTNDLAMIEQLLEVIDQEASPEDVQTFARPRLIPVFNTNAEQIANIVRQVYAERMAGSGGNQRQPSPEEFIRALRGGRGGRGGGGSAQQEESKMSIGVDTRSNSLVVSAAEPLFQEVKALVQQLDQAGAGESETVRVVTLKSASPELVQKAIVSITGGNVSTNTSSVDTPAATSGPSRGGSGNNSNNNGGQQGPTPEQMRDQIRQRIEMFNALQRGQEGGRDGGDRRGGGDRGGADAGGRDSGGGRTFAPGTFRPGGSGFGGRRSGRGGR